MSHETHHHQAALTLLCGLRLAVAIGLVIGLSVFASIMPVRLTI